MTHRPNKRNGLPFYGCPLLILLTTTLGGCALSSPENLSIPVGDSGLYQKATVPNGGKGTGPLGANPGTVAAGGKASLCTTELTSLKSVNPRSYARYRAIMSRLIASGRTYMAVQGDISQDINDVLQPRYQFALANLCWQIRSDLSASLLEQVNKSGDMDLRVNHD